MKSSPHVVHLLSSFAMGGQERMARDLAAEQVRAGYRVTAVSMAPPPDGPLASEFLGAGAAVARVARSSPGFAPTLYLRLARWFRRGEVDLVHTHNRMSLIYGAVAGRLAGAAVVHTKHGNNPKGGTRLVAGNLAARFVDCFVAVSAETADFARLRREVDERRLLVIPNGIELDRFRPDPAVRARVRAELGIGDEVWVVGTVGRIAAEKNQALLLRAMAPLLGPGAQLVVVGDGPLLPSLRSQAAGLPGARFVHFLGVRGDVPDVLNALDVFALPSSTEGLPLVIPEAMAVGLPVVATRVGGIPSTVEDGETGWLVPAGDETALRDRLAMLRADPGLARDFGVRARRRSAERYSAERMAREYIEVYRRVLGGRRLRSSAEEG